MQQVFTEYPAIYGTDDILYHIGRNLENIANKPTNVIIDELKTAISNDVNLQNALRGASGTQIQNYGNSLVRNGAFELGNTDNWVNNHLISIISEEGKYIANVSVGVIYTNDLIIVESESLYSLSFSHKNANISPFFICKQSNGTNALSSGDTQTYTVAALSSSSFVKYEQFIGGVGSGLSNFRNNTSKITVALVMTINSTIKNLVFRKVPISEPVPYTLPYLPTGQIVYDPATNDVGRFNGTDINWFM